MSARASSKLSPSQLMQLHDGELDEELEAQLLAALDADAVAELGGLEQLGDFLRSATRQHATSTQYVSIADQVMSALDAPPLKLVPRPPVEGAAAHGESALKLSQRAPVASKPAEPERGWVLGVGVVLAAAAAGLLWMQRPLSVGPAATPQAGTSPHVQATPTLSAAIPGKGPAVVAEAPVAIVSVDFGGNDGTIFVVGEESTPVVWLADDLPAKKNKMGPL